ncbi:MAG TPA: hypothetical protein VGO30_05300, partial [Mycobacterium sp.]|nr:hypothetical protein [Mycobacterium sp.]
GNHPLYQVISIIIATFLGTMGLPHVLVRFYTNPDGTAARRTALAVIALLSLFYLFPTLLGVFARQFVPQLLVSIAGALSTDVLRGRVRDFRIAALIGGMVPIPLALLASSLCPLLVLGIWWRGDREGEADAAGQLQRRCISAVAFATILAVVAGLTITASASFAHDIYASVLKNNQVTEQEQVKVSRITAVVLGVLAIGLGILANGQNVAFRVALAFAVAAAADLPTIIYSLYWPRFNTRGALWSMYGGLISTLVLIIFSPAVSGAKTAMIPSAGFAWFPLANPGIVSILLAFILGIVGTLTSSGRGNPEKNAEMEVRSLTGVGAEKAVGHP